MMSNKKVALISAIGVADMRAACYVLTTRL